jgi:branched-chain amino acid aminotransferase
MDEILAAQAAGTLTEVFASGTAAIVSPVGQMFYKGTDYVINERKIGQLTQKLYHEILQIQYGEKEDPFGWRIRID